MRALIRKWQGQNFKTVQANGNFGVSVGNFSMSALGDASQNTKLAGDFDGKITPKTEQNGGSHDQLGSVMNQNILSQVCIVGSESPDLSTAPASSRSEAYPPFQSPVQNTISGNMQAPMETTQPGMLNPLGVGALPGGSQPAGQQKSPPVIVTLLNDQHTTMVPQKPKKRKRKGTSSENIPGLWTSRSPKRRMTSGEEYDTPSPDAIATSGESTPVGTPTTTIAPAELTHHGGDSSSSSSSSSSISSCSKSDEFAEGGNGSGRVGLEVVPAANVTPAAVIPVEFGESKDDPYDYEEETAIQAPPEVHDIDMTSADVHEVKLTSVIPPVHNVERHREKKKKSSSLSNRLESRKEGKSSESQTPQTIILDLAENKSMVAPSVSITPITSSSIITSPSLSSVLTGMGLERRPGIEIIPIVTSTTTTLPSSITITPISSKSNSSSSDDRSGGGRDRRDDPARVTKVKEGKRMMSSPHPPCGEGSNDDDVKRSEKKRKRRREESLSPIDGGKQSKVPTVRLEVMGPPQIPGKSAEKSMTKQEMAAGKSVSSSLSMKSSNPSSGSSPPLSSGMRKFSSSPTHSTSVKPISLMKGSSTSPLSAQGLIKPKTSQSPKHSSNNPGSSPLYNTGSPKHSSAASPKHAGLSPKQSGSGKPSMSALKSASANLGKSGGSSSSGSGDVLLKFGKTKDKDRKLMGGSSSMSSGHQSPKLKASTVKLKQLDFSQGSELVQSVSKMMSSGNSQGCMASASSLQTNTSSSMSEKSPTASSDKMGSSAPSKQQQIRNRKGSLSAVIDKLKSAQNYGDVGICGEIKKESTGERSKEKKESLGSGASQKMIDNKNREPGKSIADGKNPEYMVKPSSDGMKITINKTRTKDSSVKMSSGMKSGSASSSPKTVTHTGLKPGVNSGPASKKPQQKIALGSSKSFGVVSTATSSGKSSCSIKSSSSSGLGITKVSKSSNSSPKQSSPGDNRRDKVRPKEKSSSPFSSKSSEQRKSSPASLRDDRSEAGISSLDGSDRSSFKSLSGNTSLTSGHAKVDSLLPLEGLKLDPKFQIPKLSRSISNDPSRIGESLDNSKRNLGEREKLDAGRHDVLKRESTTPEMKFSKSEDKQDRTPVMSEKTVKSLTSSSLDHPISTSTASPAIPSLSSSAVPSCSSPKVTSSQLQVGNVSSCVKLGNIDAGDSQSSLTHMESVDLPECKTEGLRTSTKVMDESVKHIADLVTSLDTLNPASKPHIIDGAPVLTPISLIPCETSSDEKVIQLPSVAIASSLEASKPLVVPKTQSPPLSIPLPPMLQHNDALETLPDTCDVRAKPDSNLDIKVTVPAAVRGETASALLMQQPTVPLPPSLPSPPLTAVSIPSSLPSHALPPPPPPPIMSISSSSQSVQPPSAPPLPFPASPSVSVHIVKSPAPVASPLRSPLVIASPHSTVSQASPCITDDELMDEALVGLGK